MLRRRRTEDNFTLIKIHVHMITNALIVSATLRDWLCFVCFDYMYDLIYHLFPVSLLGTSFKKYFVFFAFFYITINLQDVQPLVLDCRRRHEKHMLQTPGPNTWKNPQSRLSWLYPSPPFVSVLCESWEDTCF